MGTFPEEAHTDGSISSDGDETSSNENFGLPRPVSNDDLLANQLFDDIAFFDNEAEDWKQVLTYYFAQSSQEQGEHGANYLF